MEVANILITFKLHECTVAPCSWLHEMDANTKFKYVLSFILMRLFAPMFACVNARDGILITLIQKNICLKGSYIEAQPIYQREQFYNKYEIHDPVI